MASPSPIKLSSAERTLFRLLLHSLHHPAHSIPHNLQLRIAGGWVRDKLLGLPSNDLDIAVSNMSGLHFAKLFAAYLRQLPPAESPHVPLLGKIATIDARPEQSKHLETATATFLHLQLDFVQLRSEQYGHHSRIPTLVSFGTPLQDALRRDLTINALFYNLHSGLVEDHTQMGLHDLNAQIVRTPLDAQETMMDDPLRLIRCVRFASRLGFQLDPQIPLAARSPSITDALMEKISKERIGTEVEKMLTGPNPTSSLNMIIDLGLYPFIFSIPTCVVKHHPQTLLAINKENTSLIINSANWLDHLTRPSAHTHNSYKLPNTEIISLLLGSAKGLNSDHLLPDLVRKRLYLALALAPFRSIQVTHKKKHVWIGDLIITESLKLGNHDKHFISNLFKSIDFLQDRLDSTFNHSFLFDPPHQNGDQLEDLNLSRRLHLGRFLRHPTVHDLKAHLRTQDWRSLSSCQNSSHYQLTLLFDLVIRLASELSSGPSGLSSEQIERADRLFKLFGRLVDLINQLKLPFVLTQDFEKSRLDGNEICQALKIRPGPHLSKVIEVVVDHQMMKPELSKSEVEAWLKNQQVGSGVLAEILPSPLGGGS